MDDFDKHLLNRIQSEFPLASRPYLVLAERLGATEEEVLARARRLKAERIIRQISAIFDTRSLGYKSSLVAVRVPQDRIAAAARVINEHPGVSHNYERNHDFNLWFTIAVPPTSDLEAIVRRLHELAGAESTRLMYTLQLFKIGVNLDMTGEQPPDAISEPEYTEARRATAHPSTLSEADIAAIRELQEDLAIEPEPFAPLAERLGWSQQRLFAVAGDLQGRGFLRRVAAILYHRKAGFKANAMGVWAVPEDRVAEVGPRMASFAAVSHCYHRPTYPDWPYSVFTMVHGHDEAECETILRAISDATGIANYRSLYSTREYKKVRILFYTTAYAEWEAKYLVQSAP
ncbi:MAG: Lrp/AsnC family transcriptional regulator [Chloroflexi bacterium]|nr:Lrp/AsnC family transcriptional regulator [Chloroflexota bacterium]